MRGALRTTLAILLTVACSDQPTSTPEPLDRLEILAEAFASRNHDPAVAAELFSRAGPGPILERVRQEAWRVALVHSDADSRSWRAFLDARPDDDLATRATLSLAAALIAEEDRVGALAVLTSATETARDGADLELLELGNATAAAAAAHRLARHAPVALRNRSRSIERAALASFEHDDWLVRARSWRAAGLGSRGAAELRSRREDGDEEIQRRRELARCELDAGSSSRALNVLPARRNATPEDLVLRAEAYRLQGWGRSPDRSAAGSFRSCLEEAEQAREDVDQATRTKALILIVECGTESGELEPALAAWRRLETSGWIHPRRSWLGRRLGVALARSDAAPEILTGMASSLPEHERCFPILASGLPVRRPHPDRTLGGSDQRSLRPLGPAPRRDRSLRRPLRRAGPHPCRRSDPGGGLAAPSSRSGRGIRRVATAVRHPFADSIRSHGRRPPGAGCRPPKHRRPISARRLP